MAREGRRWQLQTAKNQFSELVQQAQQQGPQVVTRRGEEAVVVIAAHEYHQLVRERQRHRNLVKVLLSAPKVPGGLRIERSRNADRDVDLE